MRSPADALSGHSSYISSVIAADECLALWVLWVLPIYLLQSQDLLMGNPTIPEDTACKTRPSYAGLHIEQRYKAFRAWLGELRLGVRVLDTL